MKIEVIPFAQAISDKSVSDKTIVVIDVLRATSVMITVLHNGAKEIYPCQTIQQAIQNAEKQNAGSFLLCGERDAKKIDGFNHGNSPLEFTRKAVENKTLIITTTNGTKALNACREAKKIYIGAFLNLDAIVEKVKALDELVLVCSGTRGRFSLDDGMCAAAIIDSLSRQNKLSIDDLGHSLLMLYQEKQGDLSELLKNCHHLNYLNKMGYKQDVIYCLNSNIINQTPVFNPITGLVNNY